jgi:hypothetical protein
MLPGILHAQSLQNIKAVLQGEMVILTYDLVSSHSADNYSVEVYASHNNFSSPLKAVSGDVGNDIKPGSNKSISWMAKAEIGQFKGSLSFEIRATPYLIIQPYAFTSPAANSKVKKGKTLDIKWTGGLYNEPVTLKLMQNDQLKAVLAETQNKGTYSWQVPKKTPKGEYSILLTAAEGHVLTKPINVVKGGGFGRLMLFMILGGGAYYYFSLDDESPVSPTTPAAKLPLPIDPN